MAGRRLSAEERAAWAAVTRTVTPLRRRAKVEAALAKATPDQAESPSAPPPAKPRGRVPPLRPPIAKAAPPAPSPAAMLDGSWEKRIRAGRLAPDHSIDLHGMTLALAHLHLDRALGEALRAGWRVLLVVTGKPRPAPLPGAPRGRGAIRAEIGDWLAHSAHARKIASVRQAHPRHGGEGALYIILRRPE